MPCTPCIMHSINRSRVRSCGVFPALGVGSWSSARPHSCWHMSHGYPRVSLRLWWFSGLMALPYWQHVADGLPDPGNHASLWLINTRSRLTLCIGPQGLNCRVPHCRPVFDDIMVALKEQAQQHVIAIRESAAASTMTPQRPPVQSPFVAATTRAQAPEVRHEVMLTASEPASLAVHFWLPVTWLTQGQVHTQRRLHLLWSRSCQHTLLAPKAWRHCSRLLIAKRGSFCRRQRIRRLRAIVRRQRLTTIQRKRAPRTLPRHSPPPAAPSCPCLRCLLPWSQNRRLRPALIGRCRQS